MKVVKSPPRSKSFTLEAETSRKNFYTGISVTSGTRSS
ncbi:unnamed protein product [Timema podura]|uniref:Ribosomal protein L32 n=1 Tax=Timema podura TaxID=61482 RepID=A0ABN7PG89_TIMPD|nr:unnamed protein product [Timema podura]